MSGFFSNFLKPRPITSENIDLARAQVKKLAHCYNCAYGYPCDWDECPVRRPKEKKTP